MKVLSLFSGIGGFDLGLERAGFEIKATCEIDKKAQQILKRNFPNAVLYADVKDLNFSKGDFDVICGGFPCQDVSRSGKRAGLAGERSGLWFEFKRVINDVEPKWVIIENVPGLLTSAGGRDFATIIQWLAKRGYGVGWRVLDSSRFGLAQRRKRVFIVASFGNKRACGLLFKHESSARSDTEGGEKEAPNTAGDVGQDKVSVRTIAHAINNQSPMMTVIKEKTHTLSTTTVESIIWEMCHADNPVRICKDQTLSPTLLARMGTGGNSIPLVGLRRLTPVECERLQGFPDNWTAGCSMTERYKQLGNAVSVPVIKWLGEQIIECEVKNNE
jgi:DNA (cytosine-5)-methyltransferase 1